jgi:hypothetical protein
LNFEVPDPIPGSCFEPFPKTLWGTATDVAISFNAGGGVDRLAVIGDMNFTLSAGSLTAGTDTLTFTTTEEASLTGGGGNNWSGTVCRMMQVLREKVCHSVDDSCHAGFYHKRSNLRVLFPETSRVYARKQPQYHHATLFPTDTS